MENGQLRRPECRAALDEAISNADHETCRAAFRVLLSIGDAAESALTLGLRSKDPTIRLAAAREARARLEGDALVDILDRLTHDRFMPLRREALYGWVERLPHLAPLRLRRALFDPSAAVREAARFLLARSGEPDVAAVYRARFTETDDTRLAIAIAGLGETGTATDALRVEPFRSHPAARVRKAAVRALGRLDAERSLEQFLVALADESAGVVKVARELVRARLFLVSPERLWSIFITTARPHVRRAALSLIADFPWWDSAALLIAAAGAPYDEPRNKAVEYLGRWQRNCNRSAVRPTRPQYDQLAEARRRFGGSLDAAILADIDVHLAYAARQQDY